MALTADQKEQIMAQRGETKPPAPAQGGSKTTIYEIELVDGKKATMLSMSGADLKEATQSAYDRFMPYRVASVKHKT